MVIIIIINSIIVAPLVRFFIWLNNFIIKVLILLNYISGSDQIKWIYSINIYSSSVLARCSLKR